jgi:hypothetical protein
MGVEALKQAELSQLKNLEEKTGKKIEEWKLIVANRGLNKHSELVNMLKENIVWVMDIQTCWFIMVNKLLPVLRMTGIALLPNNTKARRI